MRRALLATTLLAPAFLAPAFLAPAFVAPALLASAAICGWVIVPEATHAARMLAASDDPARRADLLLQDTLTPRSLGTALESALDENDEDLASGLVAIAGENTIAVTTSQRDRLASLGAGSNWRSLRDFGSGFAYGDSQSGAAFAGALAGDVTGYGDLRDLYQEGSKLAAGQGADSLVIGLAAAGLAVSAATWTSVGAAMPARSGMTLVKTAQKAGRLSKPLMATLSRTAAAAIDRQALAEVVNAAGKLELAAAWRGAQTVLRPATFATFRTLGQDMATLYARTGQRGARQVLALAQDTGEVAQAAKLAVVKGGKTRAILALLGRSALVAISLSLTAAAWIMSFLWYLLGLAMMARRLGTWIGRKLRFRRRPAAVAQAAAPVPARMSVQTARRDPEAAPAVSVAPLAVAARRRRQQPRAARANFPGLHNDKPLLGA